MKKISDILTNIIQVSNELWRNTYPIRRWLDQKGYNNGYDLSVADELFAFYAGITLFIAYNGWASKHISIVATIVVSVAVIFVTIIIAINQKNFGLRLGFYLLALILALIGIQAIIEVSAHDLNRYTANLDALFVGILVWAGIREIAIFAINIIHRN
jgi:hypothetical protein